MCLDFIVGYTDLAIDQSQQGKGARACPRARCRPTCRPAADTIGVRGLLVHALSADAKAFYERLGFNPSPLDAMTLMVTLADLQAAL